MATWVVTNFTVTGSPTADSSADFGLQINETAPGDFDPAGVTAVSLTSVLATGSGFNDDQWHAGSAVIGDQTIQLAASLIGTTLASNVATVANDQANANSSNIQKQAISTAGTGGTINTAQTTAAWEGAVLRRTTSLVGEYFEYDKTKGGDGTAITFNSASLTITYTPGAASQDITPALVSQTVTTFAPTLTVGDAQITPGLVQSLVTTFTPSVGGGAYTPPTSPYTASFTGNNGDPWPSEWTKYSNTGSTPEATDLDIQTNEGRIKAGNSQDDYVVAVLDLEFVDGEAYAEIDRSNIIGTNPQFFYVGLRASGTTPSDTYHGFHQYQYAVFIQLDTAETGTNDRFYRVDNNVETALGASTFAAWHDADVDTLFVRFRAVDHDGDVRLFFKGWDSNDTGEPQDWTEIVTDTSPGTLYGKTGKPFLHSLDWATDGNAVDIRIPAYTAEESSLALPFTDEWTGTNGDAWDSFLWPVISGEGSVEATVDIQTNEGHFKAGNSQDDFVAMNANDVTSLQDSKGTIRINPASGTHDQWIYLCLRSTGEQTAANAGRPNTAYYFRFKLGVNQTGSSDNLYRRLSNTEEQLNAGSIDGTDASRTGSTDFWFKWEIEDNGTSVDFRWRMWDVGGSEPTGWESTSDSSPGALLGASGILQLIARNWVGGQYVEGSVDSLTYDALTSGLTITPGLVQQLVTTFAPTVAADQAFTVGLVQQLVATFDPTVVQEQFITAGFVTQLTTTFDPTLIQEQFITPGLVSQLVAAFDPTVTPGAVEVTPGLVTQLVTAFGPTVAVGAVDITPALVTQLVTTFEPAVTVGGVVIDAGFVQRLVTAFDPTVVADQAFEVGLVQQLATVFDVTVTVGGIVVTPDLVQRLVVAFDPTVAVGAVTIEPGLVTQLVAAFDPSVSAGGVAFEIGFVQQLISTFDPVVVADQAIDLGLVSQLATTFAPSVDQNPDPATGHIVLTDWSGLTDAPTIPWGQNVSDAYTTHDGGRTLHLTGNTWKWIDTPMYWNDTLSKIELDVKIVNAGEVVGIAFPTTNDNPAETGAPAAPYGIQFAGSQVWGAISIPVAVDGEWHHVVIGPADLPDTFKLHQGIIFMGDADSGANVDVWYTNVVVTLSVTPDLVQQPITPFDPTVTPGAVEVTPGLVTQLVTTFAPTVDLDTPIDVTLAATSGVAKAVARRGTLTVLAGAAVAAASGVAKAVARRGVLTVIGQGAGPSKAGMAKAVGAGGTTISTPSPDVSVAATSAAAKGVAIQNDPDQSFTTLTTKGAAKATSGAVQAIGTSGLEVYPGLVQQLVTTFEPLVEVEDLSQTITAGFVQQLVATFDPVVVPDLSIEAGLVTQLVTTFAPVVAGQGVVTVQIVAVPAAALGVGAAPTIAASSDQVFVYSSGAVAKASGTAPTVSAVRRGRRRGDLARRVGAIKQGDLARRVGAMKTERWR